MAKQKFAGAFESLVNQSAIQVGVWVDLEDCKQIDYGVVKASGTITDGAMRLLSRLDANHPPMVVLTLNQAALIGISSIGFQGAQQRPHGSQFAWEITTAIVGGAITATLNGQAD